MINEVGLILRPEVYLLTGVYYVIEVINKEVSTGRYENLIILYANLSLMLIRIEVSFLILPISAPLNINVVSAFQISCKLLSFNLNDS